MVLSKPSPYLEAFYKMNIRQPVNPVEDSRKTKIPRSPPALNKFVLEKTIDMDLTYPARGELKEVHNYGSKVNVLRHLFDHLTL
ncbi:hypothetical protein F5Y07DRAFT_365150 [Xylaria sp. FL0933]|nr:hypothetical protein F5Y07DRAFT_365150 [Xylaria sp. FL0933]